MQGRVFPLDGAAADVSVGEASLFDLLKRTLKSLIEKRLPGAGAAYRKLRDDWIYATTKPYRTQLGLTLYGDTSRHYTRGDAIQERLASREIEIFHELLSEADAFIDIGANIGIFTLLAAKAGKECTAIEAHPRNYQNLLRNLDANEVEGVACFNVALSDRVGCASLFGSGEMATLHEAWGGVSGNYSTLVATSTLDRLLGARYAGRRVLIKMDVEGFEHAVLSGAGSVLGQSPRPVWFFEHGYRENFQGVNPHYLDVFECFWMAGYQLRVAGEALQVSAETVRAAVGAGEDPFPQAINFIAE